MIRQKVGAQQEKDARNNPCKAMNAQVIRCARAQVVNSLTDSVFFTCSVRAVCHRFLVEITEPKDKLSFQSAFAVRSLSIEVRHLHPLGAMLVA
jgi:hypothetical protein